MATYSLIPSSGNKRNTQIVRGDQPNRYINRSEFPGLINSYLASYVPYTGATGDVDLGSNGLTANDLTVDAGGLVNTNIHINGSTDFSIIATATDTLKIRDATAGADRIVLGSSGNVAINSLTASRAVVTDGSKNLASSAVTATELGYVSGVTSAIQTQLDSKLESVSLTDTYIGYGDGSNELTGSSNFAWNNTNGTLSILHQFNSSANALYIRDNRVGGTPTEAELDHFKVRTQQNYCEMTLRTSQYDANATTSVNFYKGSGIGTNYMSWYSGTTRLLLMGINSSNEPILEAGSSTTFRFSVGNSSNFNVQTGASSNINFYAGSAFGRGTLQLYSVQSTTGAYSGLYSYNDEVEFKQAGGTRMKFNNSGAIVATNTQTLGTDFFNISSIYNVTGSLLKVNFTGAAGRAAEIIDNSFNDGSFKVTKSTGAAPSNSQVSVQYLSATYTHSDAGFGDGIGKGGRIEVTNNTASSGILMGIDVKATANQSGATSIGARIRSSSSSGTAIATRQEYSASIYFDTKISSTGGVTFDSVGGSASRFTFSDIINIPTKTPSSASDTGTTGDIGWDSSYLYVCTATDTWKRVALSTW